MGVFYPDCGPKRCHTGDKKANAECGSASVNHDERSMPSAAVSFRGESFLGARIVIDNEGSPMRRKILWIGTALFFALVAFAVLFPVFAQADKYSGPGPIARGLLVGDDGSPLPNRQILLLNRDGQALGTTKADENGKFEVPPQFWKEHMPKHKNWAVSIWGYERWPSKKVRGERLQTFHPVVRRDLRLAPLFQTE